MDYGCLVVIRFGYIMKVNLKEVSCEVNMCNWVPNVIELCELKDYGRLLLARSWKKLLEEAPLVLEYQAALVLHEMKWSGLEDIEFRFKCYISSSRSCVERWSCDLSQIS